MHRTENDMTSTSWPLVSNIDLHEGRLIDCMHGGVSQIGRVDKKAARCDRLRLGLAQVGWQLQQPRSGSQGNIDSLPTRRPLHLRSLVSSALCCRQSHGADYLK